MTYFEQAAEAAEFLRGKLGGLTPHIGIVLGSGLGAVADAVTSPVFIPYGTIPHFPQSTVEGHSGRIVAGLLGGVPVVVMQGRVHYYEGYTPQQVTFPMRVLGRLGIESVILTNAAGGINSNYQIGQLVLLADHINLLGFNPLVGPNEPRFGRSPVSGLRFFDMTEAYSVQLRGLAQEAAELRDSGGDSRVSRAGRGSGGHVDSAGDACRAAHGDAGFGHLLRDESGCGDFGDAA